MKRRQFLTNTASAAAVARPSIARAASATTLKFIPYADLALLDPLATALVTRNHVLMAYETLWALDESLTPQYQMLAGHTVENEGKLWTLTLRDNLFFHDGTPVRGRDVTASLRRWATRDAFGDALMQATDELAAPNDKQVAFRLKRPFPLLPNALAKPTSGIPAIMPERLATQPTEKLLNEVCGSGAFRFVPEERVSGARNVYAKFQQYVPRQGAPSFCAGARIANFDRIEWITTPDAATQAAALHAGEVDWVEQPVMDLVPTLKKDRNLRVEVLETTGLIATMRFNQLYPPFDNPAIRRAILHAVSQKDFMTAVAGESAPINDQVGFFAPSSAYASTAGLDNFAPPDLAKQREAIKAAGYNGEKIVFMGSGDVPRITAIAQVGADLMTRLGLNVDYQSLDWGTIVQRGFRRNPVTEGGWSAYPSMTGGLDWDNPACNPGLRGTGESATDGWCKAPELETLRDAWLHAPDLATQKALAAQIQRQAFIDVPIVPLGLYYQPAAFRADLTGMLKGLNLFTNVKRA